MGMTLVVTRLILNRDEAKAVFGNSVMSSGC